MIERTFPIDDGHRHVDPIFGYCPQLLLMIVSSIIFATDGAICKERFSPVNRFSPYVVFGVSKDSY